MKTTDFLTELSNTKLGLYKTAAGKNATAADKAGNFKRGNKRMSGITNATKKEFANDAAKAAADAAAKAAADAAAKAKKVEETYSAKGIMITETRTYKLWENAGRKLVEAQLTPDQIQQIFKGAQNIETAGGTNRTMIGKGKDAATAVGKAWEDLKTKAQNSKPIAGFEQKYDAVAEKLKQATGGDQGAMKYIQYYRDFAKKHPIAQGVIYAALIAAVGLSGAGVGGAAALGLLKMTDRLIQGDKFTSATYSGAKTGALAYGASQLAQQFKGTDAAASTGVSTADAVPSTGTSTATDTIGSAADAPANTVPSRFDDIVSNAKDYKVKGGDTLSDILADRKINPEAFKRLPGNEVFFGPDGNPNILKAGQTIKLPDPADIPDLNKMNYSTPSDARFDKDFDNTGYAGQYNQNSTTSLDATNNLQRQELGRLGSDNGMSAARVAKDAAKRVAGKAASRMAGMNPSDLAESATIHLSESQIYLLIGKIVNRQRKLDEGIWDSIKGQAGKAANWARTKGENLTTKITADKLLQAWKNADSPTDSDQVAKVMTGAGVPQETVDNLMKNFVQGPSAGTNTNMWQGVDRSIPAAQRKAQVAANTGSTSTDTSGAGAFSSMANQLPKSTNTSSTGGTTTNTSTGLTHTSKAVAPTSGGASGTSSSGSMSQPAQPNTPREQQAVTRTVRQQINDIMHTIMTQHNDDQPALVKELRKQLDSSFPVETTTAAPKRAAPRKAALKGKKVDNTIAMPKREKIRIGKDEIKPDNPMYDKLNDKIKNASGVTESLGLNYPETYEQTNDKFKSKGQRRVAALTNEQNYDSGDYSNARMGREYGKRNYSVDSGASHFEKERVKNEPGGELGRPRSLAGASKSLPADPFNRTTGKIPKGKTGKIHKVDMDEGKQRIDTRVKNYVPIKESAILQGLRG